MLLLCININILIFFLHCIVFRDYFCFWRQLPRKAHLRKLRLHNRYPAFVWSAAEWNNKLLLWIELHRPLDGKLIPYNKSHCVDVACPPRKLPAHVRANDSAIECPSQPQTSKLEASYEQWKLAPGSHKTLAQLIRDERHNKGQKLQSKDDIRIKALNAAIEAQNAESHKQTSYHRAEKKGSCVGAVVGAGRR
jgi:hypothetical protein